MVYLESGFTPIETLLAAIRDNVRILGMNDKPGTVEPSKLADVIVVLGNLLEDFGTLANVVQVFRDGYWVVRDGEVQPRPPKLRVPEGPGE